MPLALVPIGQTITIRRIGGNEKIRRHLASLGILEGRTIKVLAQSASGTVVLINETRLAINHEIAKGIIVG